MEDDDRGKEEASMMSTQFRKTEIIDSKTIIKPIKKDFGICYYPTKNTYGSIQGL